MLLALSCSSRIGSVTLAEEENILKTLTWESEHSHAEFVSQKISEITKDAGLKRLTHLAVDVGPGSFTGIRIAVNTIKTLSYALELPVATASSLEVLAHQVPPGDTPVICLIDAFTQSAYTSLFTNVSGKWHSSDLPRVVKSLELKNLFKSKTLCLGEGFSKYGPDISEVKSLLVFKSEFLNVPTSTVLASLAHEKIKNGLTISWKQLEPLYIRRSSAEEKLLV